MVIDERFSEQPAIQPEQKWCVKQLVSNVVQSLNDFFQKQIRVTACSVVEALSLDKKSETRGVE